MPGYSGAFNKKHMLVLALDTSTRQASVALCTESHLYGEYTWQVDNNHSVELLERIRRLCAECAISFSALDGIAVATGPGSFTGVRVAVATAKTLAFALQKPLVGCSTLEITAAQFARWPGLVCSVLEAGRGECYVACYQFASQRGDLNVLACTPYQLGEYQVLAPAHLSQYLLAQIVPLLPATEQAQAASTNFLVCGEMSEATRQALAQQGQLVVASALPATRHATTLVRLACQRLSEQRFDDPLLLEPLYLRRPSITTSVRKQPLLGKASDPITQPPGHTSTEREQGALRH
jgi:tRNA threonylcarbamoyladenosine biosynthesis protein TsaB